MASTVIESSPQKDKATAGQNCQNSQPQIPGNQPEQTTLREVTILEKLPSFGTEWGGMGRLLGPPTMSSPTKAGGAGSGSQGLVPKSGEAHHNREK